VKQNNIVRVNLGAGYAEVYKPIQSIYGAINGRGNCVTPLLTQRGLPPNTEFVPVSNFKPVKPTAPHPQKKIKTAGLPTPLHDLPV